MEKVSIIIAAYNIEEYIERCIQSCINQTYDNIEVIIVNDGSTDSTLKIISKYNRNTKVIVINKKNQGLIEARKSGYKIATGKYVLFIDGDDWLDIDAIKELYKRAKDTDSDIVWYKYFFAYEDGTYKKRNIEKKFDIIEGEEFLKRVLIEEVLPSIWSKFIRKDFIDSNNIEFPSNISFNEDLALSVSMGTFKPRVAFLDKRLYYYFQRNSSITKTISPKLLEISVATKFMKNRLEEKNLLDKYKNEFEYCAYLQNLYHRNDVIFKHKNAYSKTLYQNWKSLNIDITTNRYYKVMFKNISYVGRICTNLTTKSYNLGKIINRIG